MEQLEKGHVWLVHSMKMLGIQPWSYVGFAIFPNIANRKTLEETGLFKIEDTSRVKDKKNIEQILQVVTGFHYIQILTKNELHDPDHRVFNEIFGKTNKKPAEGCIL